MRKLFLPALFASCAAIITSCNNDKTSEDPGREIGSLHISKSKPVAGEDLDLRYSNATSSDSTEKTTGAFYYMVNKNLYANDITFKDSGKNYIAHVIIPDSATAIAFQFNKNGKVDNNNKQGYIFPLFNEDGKMMVGTRSAIANYYQANGSRFNIKMDEDSLRSYYEQDFKADPELKKEWGTNYAKSLYTKDQEAAKSFANEQIENISKKEKLTEKDYIALSGYYSNLQQKEKEDSINNILIAKFPKSDASVYNSFDTFYKEKDLEKRVALYNDFVKKSNKNGNYKDYMLRYLALGFIEKGDYENFHKYGDQIENKGQQASLYNSAASQLLNEDKDLEMAAKLSEKSIKLNKEANNKNDKPKEITSSEYAKDLKNSESFYKDTYANILFKQGKFKDAISYQEDAIQGEYTNAEMRESYLKFVLASEDYKKAQAKAEEFIKENQGSEKIKEDLKLAYTRNKGSETGFEDYLAKLEAQGHDKAIADLKKDMLSETAPGFNLTDLDGNKVSLESLKGKTVVLDFWATWCGPCKRSFPGMQMAVEKYKDSSNVAFLFVDTWENQAPDARKKEVAKFIADNNYDFHVLLDQKVMEGGSEFKVVKEYEVPGIPTKFIIDPQGKIRFKAIGFDGNSEKLAEEVEMMIELTK